MYMIVKFKNHIQYMAWCPFRKYKNECWENAYWCWTEGWCKFWLCLVLL